jgi:hypothetical protein
MCHYGMDEGSKGFSNSFIDNVFDAVADVQWANYCKHVEHNEQETWKANN